MSVPSIEIPNDAVYVYRSPSQKFEFRRPDHRPPSGMDVRNLTGIVWTEDGRTRSVALQGVGLTTTLVGQALTWRKENVLPVQPPVELFPFQQDSFQQLMRYKLATLLHSMGTGGSRVLVAAAHQRAVELGVTRVHVMAGYAAYHQLVDEFDAIARHTGVRLSTKRVERPDGVRDLATTGQVALVVPAGMRPTVSKPEEYISDRAEALTAVVDRGGVVYMSDHRELLGAGMRIVPGLVSKGGDQSSLASDFAASIRLLNY